MIFRGPVTFAEAIASRAIKALLPTTGSSADLASVQPAILERATFSARTDNYNHVATIDRLIKRLVDPDYVIDPATGERRARRPGEAMDMALAKQRMQESLRDIGYDPSQIGATPGSLKDLASERRINLILDTNLRMARGYGQFAQGQSEAVLDQWPCQELIRVESRRIPRDWTITWTEKGGRLVAGNRMVARKDDPIWTAISRFGLPYPPFDYASGMGLQDVDRDEAERLGVIGRDDQVAPQDRGFNDDLAADLSGAQKNDALLQSLVRSMGDRVEIDNGVLHFMSGDPS